MILSKFTYDELPEKLKEKHYASRDKEDEPVYLLRFEFTTSGIDCDPKDPKVTLVHLDSEKITA